VISEGLVTSPVTSIDENNQMRQLTDLIVRSPELRELEKVLGKFNLFRVLRFERGEIRHSNVLAWLLDPSESHGLRDLFLRRLLMRIFAEGQSENADTVDPVVLDSIEIRWVEVLREWRNIDLIVRIETLAHGHWVIAIENKLGSTQSAGQLAKYRQHVKESFKDASKRLFVFLTQLEEEPEDAGYMSASYRQVHEVLSECVEEQKDVIGSEPRVLLNHYLAILEDMFMEESKVADLARRIYQSHRDALDVIFEHRPDELQNLSDALKEKMESSKEDLNLVPMLCNKGYIRFIPTVWNTPENRTGKAWGSSGSAYVLCEVGVSSRWPQLKMVEGKAPDAWRNELWAISSKPPFKKTQKRLKQPEMWMSFYSVKNSTVNLNDLELGQEEETAESVWKWVKSQLEDTDFQASVKIVADHLAKLNLGYSG
jgi:hypothetical protein